MYYTFLPNFVSENHLSVFNFSWPSVFQKRVRKCGNADRNLLRYAWQVLFFLLTVWGVRIISSSTDRWINVDQRLFKPRFESDCAKRLETLTEVHYPFESNHIIIFLSVYITNLFAMPLAINTYKVGMVFGAAANYPNSFFHSIYILKYFLKHVWMWNPRIS